MSNKLDIDVFPVNGEDLSPQEFIDLVAKNPDLIRRTTFKLPRLGSPGFGKISVEYNRPRYKALAPFKPIAR
jgi:hypothetical protein